MVKVCDPSVTRCSPVVPSNHPTIPPTIPLLRGEDKGGGSHVRPWVGNLRSVPTLPSFGQCKFKPPNLSTSMINSGKQFIHIAKCPLTEGQKPLFSRNQADSLRIMVLDTKDGSF